MTHTVRSASANAAPSPPAVRSMGARVTRDTLWLTSGYAVTSLSGFVFWVLAAAWLPPAQLGVEASILSAVMAAAALASNGPGCALVVMLPLGGAAARSALRRAYATTALLALPLGLLASVPAIVFLPRDASPVATVATVVVGTLVWALFNLQTQALAGASDARATLIVNGSVNLLKLGLFAVIAIALPGVPEPLVVATLVPAAIGVLAGVLVFVPRALRREQMRHPSDRRWDAGLARTFRVFTAQNAVAVGLVLCVGLSLPFLVTVLSSPEQGAVFAIAYQFGVALDLVGVAVATALARSAVGDFATGLRVAVALVAKVSLAVAAFGLAATLAAPILFAVVGRDYSPWYGVAVVGALALASAIRPGYDIWSALVRAQHHARPVLLGNALAVAIVLGGMFLLAPALGALGAALCTLAAASALAVIGVVGLRRLGRQARVPAPTPLAFDSALDPQGAVR